MNVIMVNILLAGVDYSCWRLSVAKLRPSLTSAVGGLPSSPPESHVPLVFPGLSSLPPLRTELIADAGLVRCARSQCADARSPALGSRLVHRGPNANMIEDCHGPVNLDRMSLLSNVCGLIF